MAKINYLGFLILLVSSAASANSAEPSALLEKCKQAWAQTSFQGTLIYQNDHQLQSIELNHAPLQSANALQTLNGDFHQILSTGKQLAINGQVVAKSEGQANEALGQRLSLLDSSQISQGYRVSHQGFERVSGRKAHVLLMEPKDEFRFTYRMLIDEQTNLLVGMVVMDTGGVPLEKMLFTRLNVQSVASNVANTPGQVGPGNATSWRFTSLPAGFKVISEQNHMATSAQSTTKSAVISDGLAVVSFFVEPKGETAFTDAHSVGAMNAIALNKGAYQVIVVGDVPFVTLETLAHRWEATQ